MDRWVSGLCGVLVGVIASCASADERLAPTPQVLKAVPTPSETAASLPVATAALSAPAVDGEELVDVEIRMIELRRPLQEMLKSGESPSISPAATAAKGPEPQVANDSKPGIGPHGGILSPQELAKVITVCQSNRHCNILMAPRLRLKLGTKGLMRDGIEVPITEPGANQNPNGKPTPVDKTEFFGTAVEATVTRSTPNLLHVALTAEHSTRLPQPAAADGIPRRDVRRVSTQFDLKSGQTLLLNGLKSNREFTSETRLPVLGDLPAVGKMFTKVKSETVQNELVVLVTATLIADDAE